MVNPYYSLNDYLQTRFGGKVAKVSLDAGFTCPNRDGSKGWGGCAFCSSQGSGEFAGDSRLSLREQYKQVRVIIARKWPRAQFIVHFQAFTNTYAPVDKLKLLYSEALSWPGVVGLAIATRPDCLGLEVIELLAELNRHHFIWVELGIQTSHDAVARALNLGYTYAQAETAVQVLHQKGIPVVGHLIYGLPGETQAMMQETADRISRLPLWGIKIHLFHLLKGSALEHQHKKEPLNFLSRQQYLDLVIYTLERLSPQVIIHRLTGDPPRRLLIEPAWSTDKWVTLNELRRQMTERETYQGRLFIS